MNKKLILIVCLFITCILASSFGKVLAFPASLTEIYDGVDVSEWQGNIDFAEVKDFGIDIVYIKSSEGTRYIDPYFRTNYNSAKENGLNIGFYHFMTATTENEAITEARFFASVVDGLDADCRLAMDFEVFNGLNIAEINDISLTFLTEVERLTKKEVVIYSDAYNARNIFSKELSSRYPIWVAEYGVSEPENGNWSSWIGFQYTNQGRVSGISGFVDRDYFTPEIFLSDSSTITVPDRSMPSVNTDFVIVKRGNTLTQISRLYGVSIDTIVRLNDIQNPNLIFAGEVLRIPTIN